MSEEETIATDDRRKDVRLAGRGPVEVVRVDQHGQPVELLEDTRLQNISAGGATVVSSVPVAEGAALVIAHPDEAGETHLEGGVHLSALECVEVRNNLYKIRCALAEGMMPADLIYGW